LSNKPGQHTQVNSLVTLTFDLNSLMLGQLLAMEKLY